LSSKYVDSSAKRSACVKSQNNLIPCAISDLTLYKLFAALARATEVRVSFLLSHNLSASRAASC